MQSKTLGVVIVGLLALGIFVTGAGADFTDFPGEAQISQSPTQTELADQLHETSFQVDTVDAPAETTAGETINVSAELTNPASAPMIQFVEFRFQGDVVERTAFALNPGESDTVTFEVNTSGIAAGTYVHSVQTQDFGQVASIDVLEASVETPTPTPVENQTATPTGNETETPSGTPSTNQTETPVPSTPGTATMTPTQAPTGNETATAGGS